MSEILEIWRPVSFKFEDKMSTRYEVSNLGRIRSFGKDFEGRIVIGSMTDGFKCLRIKIYRPQTKATQEKLTKLRERISYLRAKRRALKKEKDKILQIKRITTSINIREKEWSKILAKDKKKRVTCYSILFHHLVAQAFLKKKKNQVVIAHLDYNKLNNRVENLQWMTREEHTEHINQSPNVIEAKLKRKLRLVPLPEKGHKLDTSQVLHIKKLLKRGWKQKEIAKNFNISTMQVSRIKTGENWSHVKLPEDISVWDNLKEEMLNRENKNKPAE